MSETYEIHAVRYGSHTNLIRAQCFLGWNAEDIAPCPLDYFFWVVRNESRVILIDTGASLEEAVARNRTFDFRPRDGISRLGVDPDSITDVVVTHMHWDHAGTLDDFPNARFHIQSAEMAYVTGPCMRYLFLRTPFTFEHVSTAVRLLHQGRVVLHDGDATIAPGVTAHLLGGHSKGLQCVRVATARGAVVVASDAAHFYDNFRAGHPFFIAHSFEDTLRGYERLMELADGPDHVIPGHDTDVLKLYPASAPGLAGISARVDLSPAVG